MPSRNQPTREIAFSSWLTGASGAVIVILLSVIAYLYEKQDTAALNSRQSIAECCAENREAIHASERHCDSQTNEVSVELARVQEQLKSVDEQLVHLRVIIGQIFSVIGSTGRSISEVSKRNAPVLTAGQSASGESGS